MKARLTEKGIKVANKIQIPICARDKFNETLLSEKVESGKMRELKKEIIVLAEKNEFYGLIIKAIEAIEEIESDKKELIMTERGMTIKIV